MEHEPLITINYRAACDGFCLSVRPCVRVSICLSDKRVICDNMEERSVQILYHTKERLA